jgi:DNA polymerase III sliding clamp (beta) subunit (PCNA family)
MQKTEQKSNAKRRRTGNRSASNDRFCRRMNTSCGEPVHISFYIRPLLDRNGNIDREKKIVKSFHSHCDG